MSNEITEKDIRKAKFEKVKTAPWQIREKPKEQLMEEAQEIERKRREEEKIARSMSKHIKKTERLKKLQKKRETLLAKKKQQLELERTKAEIKQLKRETGITGKITPAVSKIKERIKQERRKRRPTQYHPRRKTTGAKAVSNSRRFVIIGGKAYPIGKISKSKKRKKKKEDFLF